MENFKATIMQDGVAVATGVDVTLEVVHGTPLGTWHGEISGLPDLPSSTRDLYRLVADDGREGDIIIQPRDDSSDSASFQGSGPFG